MPWQTAQGRQLLAPFGHQVAGQSSMLWYDATTVCKPLIPRENFVYKTLPQDIREFTPEYRGEIEVELQEHDGYISLYGVPVATGQNSEQEEQSNQSMAGEQDNCLCPCSAELENPNSPIDKGQERQDGAERCVIRVLRSGSYEVSSSLDEVFYSKGSQPQNTNHTVTQHHTQSDSTHQHQTNHAKTGTTQQPHTQNLNPWSLKNHKRLLDKMRKSEHNCKTAHFILLKNVVAGLRHPCILDLKIGSRLHADDATHKKVASQSHKCNLTTSSSLGVRLCGMQVHQVDSGIYKSHDKYYGRTLTDASFKATLYEFLHNGYNFRSELLPLIIRQLNQLIERLQGLSSFRFYASSLLIIYGCEVEDSNTKFVSGGHTDGVQLLPTQCQNIPVDREGNGGVSNVPVGNLNDKILSGNRGGREQVSSIHDHKLKNYFNSSCVLDKKTTCGSVQSNISVVKNKESADQHYPIICTYHNAKAVQNPSNPVNFNYTVQDSPSGVPVSDSSRELDMASCMMSHNSGSILPSVVSDRDSVLVSISCHHTQPQGSQHANSGSTTISSTTIDQLRSSADQISTTHSHGSDNKPKRQLLKSSVYTAADVSGTHYHSPPHHDSADFTVNSPSVQNIDKDNLKFPPENPNSDHNSFFVNSVENISLESVSFSTNNIETTRQEDSDGQNARRWMENLTNEQLDNPHNRKDYVGGDTHQSIETKEAAGTVRRGNTDLSDYKEERVWVDVRMIDFAHTTHSGFPNDKVKHSGPDIDYITGLKNLVELFQQLDTEN